MPTLKTSVFLYHPEQPIGLQCELSEGEEIYRKASLTEQVSVYATDGWEITGPYPVLPQCMGVQWQYLSSKDAKNAVIASISLLTLYLKSHVVTVHLMAGEGI